MKENKIEEKEEKDTSCLWRISAVLGTLRESKIKKICFAFNA